MLTPFILCLMTANSMAAAGAICAARHIVLLFAHGTDNDRAIPQIEQPGKSGAPSPLVSSNASKPQL